jgi:hypothetical protein
MKIPVFVIALFISIVIVSSCKKTTATSTENLLQNTWAIQSENEYVDGYLQSTYGGLVLGNVTFTDNGQEIRNSIFGPVYIGNFASVSGNNPDTGYYSLINNNTKIVDKFTWSNLPYDTTVYTNVDTLNISYISNHLLVLSGPTHDTINHDIIINIDSLTR